MGCQLYFRALATLLQNGNEAFANTTHTKQVNCQGLKITVVALKYNMPLHLTQAGRVAMCVSG
ncbi:MAG: hypothetical protein ACI96W_002812 [Paraglaciecola sp.]|jgi:hypothetical protein